MPSNDLGFKAARFADRSLRLSLAGALAASLLLGCDDGITPPPPAPPPSPPAAPAIAVSVNLLGVAVPQGQNNTVAITVGRTSYTGSIDLTAEGLPAGVTAGFSVASLPNGTTSSTLTLTAVANAPLGQSTVIVRASGTGVTAQTATLTVTVTPLPAISIAVAPGTLSVPQGTIGAAQVTITRMNFTGPVTLAASGLPAGVTHTPGPPSTGATATLPLAAVSSAGAGSFTVTVTASGTGVANAVATFTLDVAPAAGTLVSQRFCGPAAQAPLWVAAQDENGPWRQLTREANETYRFGIAARGGIAFVERYEYDGTTFLLSIRYGALADLQRLAAAPCLDSGAKSVTATAAGFGAGESVSAIAGGAESYIEFPTTGFSLSGLPDGLVDLVATRRSSGTATATKFILRPGINPANGAALPVLDFGSAEAVDAEARTVTVGNPTAGEILHLSTYIQTGGGTGAFLSATSPATGVSAQYHSVPLAGLGALDVQSLTLWVVASNAPFSPTRLVGTFYRSPQDLTVTLGAALNAATVSVVATNPQVRLRAETVRQADYPRYYRALYYQFGSPAGHNVILEATAAYMGSAPSFDFTMPDFSGVPGWLPTWNLIPGQSMGWEVSGYGFTGAPLEGFTPAPAEGIVFRSASRSGTIVP